MKSKLAKQAEKNEITLKDFTDTDWECWAGAGEDLPKTCIPKTIEVTDEILIVVGGQIEVMDGDNCWACFDLTATTKGQFNMLCVVAKALAKNMQKHGAYETINASGYEWELMNMPPVD